MLRSLATVSAAATTAPASSNDNDVGPVERPEALIFYLVPKEEAGLSWFNLQNRDREHLVSVSSEASAKRFLDEDMLMVPFHLRTPYRIQLCDR